MTNVGHALGMSLSRALVATRSMMLVFQNKKESFKRITHSVQIFSFIFRFSCSASGYRPEVATELRSGTHFQFVQREQFCTIITGAKYHQDKKKTYVFCKEFQTSLEVFLLRRTNRGYATPWIALRSTELAGGLRPVLCQQGRPFSIVVILFLKHGYE